MLRPDGDVCKPHMYGPRKQLQRSIGVLNGDMGMATLILQQMCRKLWRGSFRITLFHEDIYARSGNVFLQAFFALIRGMLCHPTAS